MGLNRKVLDREELRIASTVTCGIGGSGSDINTTTIGQSGSCARSGGSGA
ncbi:MAG: hypothetical protein HC820_05450 [Hydrococcus sp. RM1_1_31]|nr:hypothetical protein [Hydrococcus sp. RM1_1_31]